MYIVEKIATTSRHVYDNLKEMLRASRAVSDRNARHDDAKTAWRQVQQGFGLSVSAKSELGKQFKVFHLHSVSWL